MKNALKTLIISLFAGIAGAWFFVNIINEPQKTSENEVKLNQIAHGKNEEPNIQYVNNYTAPPSDVPIDFRSASEISTKSVVFIKTFYAQEYETINLLDWFFNNGSTRRTQEIISSGSGVIYSKDGYIITNNHVIDKSQRIVVNIGKRNYDAEVVGTDPGTDIAILKVDGKDLPAVTVASSRKVQVGDWVLAVGNPFNLTSTVTAGIVSAKGRNLNKISNKFPIDFFIQTDAAINPGNSGGALVNTKGELIGINTAILSPSGAFSGYGFAVPVDIVAKVAKDIISYGKVQKAYLGVEIQPIDEKLAERLKLNNLDGVAVTHVEDDMPGKKAGIEVGDVIIRIDNIEIQSEPEYDEQLSYYRPGDKIKLVYKSGNKIMEKDVVLNNIEGGTDILKRVVYDSKFLGAELEVLGRHQAGQMRINSGVMINKVSGGLFNDLGVREGFVITAINGQSVKKPEEVEKILKEIRGRVRIEGINKNNIKGYYSFYF